MGVIKFLLKKIPAIWWRKGIQIYLVSACSFYLLHIAMDLNLVERYTALLVKSYFWYFVILQVLITIVFYVVLDFFLRLLFHKVIKRKIIDFQNKLNIPRIDYLKSLTQIKNGASSFVLGFPVELGYINRQDFLEITFPTNKDFPDLEKEEALNEIMQVINKWACVLIHMAVTMLVVFKYDKTLMIFIFIGGFFITLIVFSVLIIFVKNIGIFELVLRELKKRSQPSQTRSLYRESAE